MHHHRLLGSGQGADQVLGGLDENIFQVVGDFVKGMRWVWDYFQHGLAPFIYGPYRPPFPCSGMGGGYVRVCKTGKKAKPAGPKTSHTQPP